MGRRKSTKTTENDNEGTNVDANEGSLVENNGKRVTRRSNRMSTTSKSNENQKDKPKTASKATPPTTTKTKTTPQKTTRTKAVKRLNSETESVNSDLATTSKSKRQRKNQVSLSLEDATNSKSRSSNEKQQDQPPPPPPSVTQKPQLRGRRSTNLTKSKAASYKFDDESDESEQDNNSDDSEFKLEGEDAEVEEEQEEEEDEIEEEDEENNKSELKELNESTKRFGASRRQTNAPIKQEVVIPEQVPLKTLEIIKEWTYILDPETNYYKYPLLPELDDCVIQPFISDKSASKYQIYTCPYCKKLFTYSLVFKHHLYSCPKSPNCEYVFLCADENCKYKAIKKQIMIDHYKKKHLDLNEDDDLVEHENDDSCSVDSKKSRGKLSKRFEKFSYSYIDDYEYQFAFDNYKNIYKNYKNLQVIDQLLTENSFEFVKKQINLNEISTNHVLNIKLTNLNGQIIKLKPFYQYKNDVKQVNSINLSNFVNQITSMDWAYSNDNEQYLAVCTLPIDDLCKQIDKSFGSGPRSYELKQIYRSINLIHILKYNKETNSLNLNEQTRLDVFSIINRRIGYVYCLKWRRDCGVCCKDKRIGYLLATSSNGCGYVYAVENLFAEHQSESSVLDAYEPSVEICLKCDSSYFGQCTTADWCQLNGATQIALGYMNGSINLFNLNDNHYCSLNDTKQCIEILPCRLIDSHLTYVRTLKWSKTNHNILVSGSLFSRELKVWNLLDTEEYLLDYEIFITELDVSLHVPDIFIGKEANLKGESRLCVLDPYYDAFHNDKEQTRTHSSFFHTYSSLNSIDLSDLYNKCLICDSKGLIFLNKANDIKRWIHKHKSMRHTFAQIAKFTVENKENSELEDSYNVNMEELKLNKIIKLDLNRNSNREALKSDKVYNSNHVDLNNLTKIRWNQSIGYENLYAVGSICGLLFIHLLNDLKNENIEEPRKRLFS